MHNVYVQVRLYRHSDLEIAIVCSCRRSIVVGFVYISKCAITPHFNWGLRRLKYPSYSQVWGYLKLSPFFSNIGAIWIQGDPANAFSVRPKAFSNIYQTMQYFSYRIIVVPSILTHWPLAILWCNLAVFRDDLSGHDPISMPQFS